MSTVRRYTEARILRLGAITLVVMLADHGRGVQPRRSSPGSAAHLPGRVHRRERPAQGQHGPGRRHPGRPGPGRRARGQQQVLVTFEVDHGVEFGKESQASVEVLNLLGEKYLELVAGRRRPARRGRRRSRSTAPQSAYDIVGVFGDLTETTEQIDTDQLDAGARRRRRHHQPGRAGDRGQLPRASPGSRSRWPRATTQIQALLQSSQRRQQAARRPQRRPRRPDEEQRPGLQGGRAPQGGDPPAAGQRPRPRRPAARRRRPTTRPRSGPRSRRSTTCSSLLNSKEKELKATLDALGPYVVDPRQHHRHRPVVRRLRRPTWPRSPPASSCPGRRRADADERPAPRQPPGRDRRRGAGAARRRTFFARPRARPRPRRSPRTSRARSASTRAPTCASSASTSAGSPR